jgi:predicted  nucleic acid-binding Zn-ribbon protein
MTVIELRLGKPFAPIAGEGCPPELQRRGLVVGKPEPLNADLHHLIQLQELDLTAERQKRRIADIPVLQANLDARLAECTAAVDAVKARMAVSQSARREIEKDLAAVQSRLSKFKNQLMEVRTNKEYQAMQKEMSVAEQEISDHETRMLERMEESDALALELKSAEAALKSAQGELAREREQLEAERNEIERNIQRTLDERAAVASQTSREALAIFDRIAHGRKGLAVAEARDGLCTVCHVRLRPQVFNEARRNEGIIQCDSCGRILYFVPAPSAAASPQQP